MNNDISVQSRLTIWNPIDHIRLIIWLFLKPSKYTAYEAIHGERSLQRLGAWLASSLTWFPLLVAGMGSALGFTPIPAYIGSGIVGLVLVAWVLTGWLGQAESEHSSQIAGVLAIFVAFVVAFIVVDRLTTSFITLVVAVVARGVAVTAALGRASGIAGGVSIGVAISVAVLVVGGLEGGLSLLLSGAVAVGFAVIMHYGIVQTLQRTLNQGKANFWSKSVLFSVAVSYLGLIWIYLLGGWRVLYSVQNAVSG